VFGWWMIVSMAAAGEPETAPAHPNVHGVPNAPIWDQTVGMVLTKEILARIPSGRAYQPVVVLSCCLSADGSPRLGQGLSNDNTFRSPASLSPTRGMSSPARCSSPTASSRQTRQPNH